MLMLLPETCGSENAALDTIESICPLEMTTLKDALRITNKAELSPLADTHASPNNAMI